MWSGLSQLALVVTQFMVIVVLARLLSPADFGLIAMATFFTELIGRVSLGFRFPIIQRKEITPSHLSTIFWAGIAAGVVLWGISAAVSPLMASFFRNDLVRPITIVLSIEFIISSFGLVQSSLLSRDLDFKKLAIVDMVTSLANGVFAISLAYAHFGVWSLVWGSIVSSSVTVVLLWKLYPWRPRLHFSFGSLRDLSGFGAAVVGNSIVNHVGNDMDRLLMGRLLGPGNVGFFSQASRATQFPKLISQVVARVTFPALSSVQDDYARIRRGYLKSVTYVSLATFPLLSGLAVVAPEFVRVVLGAQWIPMVLPLRVLCVVGITGSLGPVLSGIAFVTGRADLALKLNLVKIPLIVAAILFGARFGITGVASAIAVFSVGEFLIIQLFMNHLIRLRMVDWLYSMFPAVLGVVGMVIVLLPLRWLVVTFLSIPDFPLLVFLVLVGAFTYLFSLLIARVKEVGEIRELLVTLLPHVRR